ncbi:kelch repeat-containing protein [Pyxidicoccus parkwayensis]|nr:kelch repeat-containing protein [Pyxidicoccus parkwaysis]
MASPRSEHSVTLLNKGRVLVAGGSSGSVYLVTAELYDLASSTWSATGSMASPRYYHTATLLPDGKVLVAGGYIGSSSLAGAEVYTPCARRHAVETPSETPSTLRP